MHGGELLEQERLACDWWPLPLTVWVVQNPTPLRKCLYVLSQAPPILENISGNQPQVFGTHHCIPYFAPSTIF